MGPVVRDWAAAPAWPESEVADRAVSGNNYQAKYQETDDGADQPEHDITQAPKPMTPCKQAGDPPGDESGQRSQNDLARQPTGSRARYMPRQADGAVK